MGEEFSPIHGRDNDPGLILPYILSAGHTGITMHEKNQTDSPTGRSLWFFWGGVAAGGLLLCL